MIKIYGVLLTFSPRIAPSKIFQFSIKSIKNNFSASKDYINKKGVSLFDIPSFRNDIMNNLLRVGADRGDMLIK